MSWIDITFMVVISLSMVLGVYRGIVREVLSLVVWASAIWLSVHYSSTIAEYFKDHIESQSIRLLLGFIAILLSVLFAGAIAIHVVVSIIHMAPFNATDRILGLGFGIARGTLLCAVLIFLAGLTNLPQRDEWHASEFVPHLQWVANYAQEFLPTSMSEHFEYG